MSALTYATAQLLRILPRETITRVAGTLADHRWSESLGRAVVGAYSQAYKVTLDDCVERGGWESFDAFFTRALRDGVRPLHGDAAVVVSPADGRVESMGRVGADSTFLVKGASYRVEDLVGGADEARRYVGGAGCVIYLSPRDYHRVHSPVTGTVAHVRSMPGDYFPVNAIGIRHVPGLFARNRRVAIAIDTPPETGLGRVTVVMVAAMIVGRITVSGIDARDVPVGDHVPARRALARGEELGRFHLGSTAVVLLEPGAAGKWLAAEGAIRYGEGLSLAAHAVGGAGGAPAASARTPGDSG